MMEGIGPVGGSVIIAARGIARMGSAVMLAASLRPACIVTPALPVLPLLGVAP
jgi:hypothetical protein